LICERVDSNGDLYFKALSFTGRWIPNQINELEEGNRIYWYTETKYSNRTNALYEKSYRRRMIFEGYDELHALLSIGFRERGDGPLIFRDNNNYLWGASVRGPWTNILDRKTLALRENYRYLHTMSNGENITVLAEDGWEETPCRVVSGKAGLDAVIRFTREINEHHDQISSQLDGGNKI
jgi:hypothetical protein